MSSCNECPPTFEALRAEIAALRGRVIPMGAQR